MMQKKKPRASKTQNAFSRNGAVLAIPPSITSCAHVHWAANELYEAHGAERAGQSLIRVSIVDPGDMVYPRHRGPIAWKFENRFSFS